MPRFRISRTSSDLLNTRSGTYGEVVDDLDFDDTTEYDDPPTRRARRVAAAGPRLVREGRSGRVIADRDPTDSPVEDEATERDATEQDAAEQEAPYSSYDVATHGPSPVPDWLITSFSARDTPLGALKSGKEADVTVLDRSLPGGPGCLLAVKTYRDASHRMFHRDSGYQEGRRTRRSRENRAMAARTGFGRDLLSAKWAGSEFAVLSTLWRAGAKVPYPVQILGSELMMEFVGEPDGVAAPRLAAYDGDTQEFTELWRDLVASLEVLAAQGLTHGDLSPYNVLVTGGGCVLIDLPQAVDVVANPQGESFLIRDCTVIADFFARHGVLPADGELLALHLGGIARG